MKPLVTWFGFRAMIIACFPVAIHWIMTGLLQAQRITWGYSTAMWNWLTYLLMGASCLAGLVIVKVQFSRLGDLAVQPKKQQNPFSPRPEAIRDDSLIPQEDGEGDLGMSDFFAPEALDNGAEHKDVDTFGRLMERSVGRSIADSAVSMELEVPPDTDLTIFGQKVKVKKGKIKVTPRKTPSQQYSEFFGLKAKGSVREVKAPRRKR